MKRFVVALLILVSCNVASLHAAAPIPPAPTGGDYIVDNADILSDDQEATLNGTLADYESRTSTEIGILTVRTIENDYIENFSLSVAREWGIGQKDKNNGALLVVSVDDRKLRIEVGTGLEGDLTDSRSGQIIRNRITPAFKEGNYYEGISSGINGMILAINAEDDPNAIMNEAESGDWIGIIIFAAYMFLMVISWFGAMLGRSKRWWPGGIAGGVLGGGLGGMIGGRLSIALISGFVLAAFGFLFDYVVSKNYRQAKASGHDPSWWAGGGFGGSGSGVSGGFGGGGGFSGGGSSGSW